MMGSQLRSFSNLTRTFMKGILKNCLWGVLNNKGNVFEPKFEDHDDNYYLYRNYHGGFIQVSF